jgi:CO/xanthine dehydrogenase FAD-binding subunit
VCVIGRRDPCAERCLAAARFIQRERQDADRFLVGVEAHRVLRFDEIEQELRPPPMGPGVSTSACDMETSTPAYGSTNPLAR